MEFKCEKCGKSFTLKHNLLRHNREVHDESRRLRCFECDSQFSRAQYLNEHMTLIHSSKYTLLSYVKGSNNFVS